MQVVAYKAKQHKRGGHAQVQHVAPACDIRYDCTRLMCFQDPYGFGMKVAPTEPGSLPEFNSNGQAFGPSFQEARQHAPFFESEVGGEL
jgi:hypothetical protein